MPKFIADSYFLSGGKLVEPGGEVELTEERAKALGSKVKAKETKSKKADEPKSDKKPKAEA